MKTVILCGGRGTRAYPHTLEVPKPLLTVADRPVLLHVMELYAAQGFTDFVLSAGYKAEMIEAFAGSLPDSWHVEVVNTGESTNTAGRIRAVRDRLDETFLATYADGLGDVDLHALLDFHRGHGGGATLTTVPLPSPYGTIDIGRDGRVKQFREKPQLTDHYINAGFFVFDQFVVDQWEGEDLEREVLPALGKVDALFAFHHGGFWRSMDTYKDSRELTELCDDDGHGPWVRRCTRPG